MQWYKQNIEGTRAQYLCVNFYAARFYNVFSLLIFFIFFVLQIFLLLFLLLCISSYALIARFRRRDREDYFSVDEDDATVYRISLLLCTVALAVSIGATLLLPISIASNEVLILYPNSYYVKWLNSSLIQGETLLNMQSYSLCSYFQFMNLKALKYYTFMSQDFGTTFSSFPIYLSSCFYHLHIYSRNRKDLSVIKR